MKRLVIAVGFAVIANTAGATDAVVGQHDHLFDPAKLKVAPGTTVHFVNAQNVIHHVYSDSAGLALDSGDIPPGGDFAAVFDKTGRFLLRCAIHPQMRVEVEVGD